MPAKTEALPFEDFLNTPVASHASHTRTTPSSANSYADITRNLKRTMAERVGVSPLDLPNKRHALQSPPLSELATPCDQTNNSSSIFGIPMETSTPEADRPYKAITAQRRLFPNSGKENSQNLKR